MDSLLVYCADTGSLIYNSAQTACQIHVNSSLVVTVDAQPMDLRVGSQTSYNSFFLFLQM